MSYDTNPFPDDPDRSAIWDMLVHRDIDAYLAGNWDAVQDDFIAEGFIGINGNGAGNADRWTLGFAQLEDYRAGWLGGVVDPADFAEDLRTAIFRATSLDHIDINGDMALAHKKFDGSVERVDGTQMVLKWQSLYYLRRIGGRWKIFGFTGYLPNPMKD